VKVLLLFRRRAQGQRGGNRCQWYCLPMSASRKKEEKKIIDVQRAAEVEQEKESRLED
jgi:hypothetical protein